MKWSLVLGQWIHDPFFKGPVKLILFVKIALLTLFGLGGGGSENGPLRVFAKYLKNGSANLQETLWLLRPIYRSSFEIKSLKIGH